MKRIFLLLIASIVTTSFYSQVVYAQINNQSALGPKYGQDSAKCVMEISLYREFYKQWRSSNYKLALNDALIHWRWVFVYCPLGTENTYVDGAKMFNFLAQSITDNTLKEKFIDTLMMIYDQRIKYFPLHYKEKKPQEGEILGRKGIDLYQLKPSAYEETYKILKRSVDLQGAGSAAAVLVYYFMVTTQMANDGKIPKEIVLDTYDQVITIIDTILKNQTNPEQLTELEVVKTNIDQMFEPFATCNDLVNIYTKKFNQKGEDPEVLKKITSMLYKKNCTDSQLYFDATNNLYKLEPTPESAYFIGRMLIKKQEYNDATKFLLSATNMSDTNSRADCYLLLADTYRNLNDYPKARSFAFKSVELRPKDGNPYILIGDLYATSAKDCSEDEFTQKTIYWTAVDKYIKAKNVDPKISDVADERISSYMKAFPSAEANFFHDLKEGDTYLVECWINETTTVRAAK
ncbi:MAG: tetratricopeptide repeat protein [Bacteroidetes bacterium]|nr:tetratricopeptide repeat protein [Bacteroidota bacterium]